MKVLTNTILSTVLQIIVFLAIPFLFYLFRKDKSVQFSKYIGFTKPTAKSLQLAILTSFLFVIAGIGLALLDKGIKEAFLSPETVTGQLHQMGLSYLSITVLLITALSFVPQLGHCESLYLFFTEDGLYPSKINQYTVSSIDVLPECFFLKNS